MRYFLAVLVVSCLFSNAHAQDCEMIQLAPFELSPLAFNTRVNEDKRLGDLTYIYGFHVKSEHENFGGISGMVFDGTAPQGDGTYHYFQLVTDNGYNIDASIKFESATIKFHKGYQAPIVCDEAVDTKVKYDSEAITHLKKRRLIAYEQDHRLSWDDNIILNKPSSFSQLESNGGIEAITALDERSFIMFAERPTRGTKKHLAWIGSMETVGLNRRHHVTYEARTFHPPPEYDPTDATTLKNGDILLVLRRFTLMDGASAKILHITKEEIASGRPLEGTIIAELPPELGFDNLEALAAEPVEGGHNLYLMSDDNFSPAQKTVLLKFFYPE